MYCISVFTITNDSFEMNHIIVITTGSKVRKIKVTSLNQLRLGCWILTKNTGLSGFCDGKFGKLFIENDGTSLLHIIKYIFIPGYINFLIEIIKPWILKSSFDGWGALFFTSRIILSVVLWSKSVCLNLVYFKLQMHIIRSIFYEIQTFSKIICKLIGFLFVNARKAFRSISKSNLKPKVRNFQPQIHPLLHPDGVFCFRNHVH